MSRITSSGSQKNLLASLFSLAVSWMVIIHPLTDARIHGQDSPNQKASEGAPKLPLYPLDIAVNEQGVAFVADRNLPGVWKWENGNLSVYYQGSPQYRTPLNAPRCVALEKDGTLLVGDTATMDIYRIREPGKAEPITDGKIGTPMDIAVAGDGTIYVADLQLRKLLKIPAGSTEVVPVAAVNPRGVYVDDKQQIWVISQNAEQLLRVGSDGKVESVVKERTFEFPHQVVVTSSGALVTDGYRRAVWKVIEGQPPEVLVAGDPLGGPVGIALTDGTPVIVDPKVRKVFKLNDQSKLEEWFEVKRP